MKCHECEKAGEKSVVHSLGGFTTCMGGGHPFWDEDEKFHRHDPNWTTWQYNCSKGHQWSEKRRSSCPTCGTDF